MKLLQIGALVCAVGVVFGAGYAVAQSDDKYTDWEDRYGTANNNLTLSYLNDDSNSPTQNQKREKVWQSLQEAVGQEKRTSFVVGRIMTDEKAPQETRIMALQAMQNQRIIEQNAQIIALLKANKSK